MSRRSLTLRVTLTTLITAMILVVSGLVLGVAHVGGTRSVLLLSKGLTAEVARSIRARVARLFGSAEAANHQLAHLVRGGIVSMSEGDRLMELAEFQLSANDGFTSVNIADTEGNKYQAERMEDGSISRRAYRRKEGGVEVTWHHRTPGYSRQFPDRLEDLKNGYDPRKRPWWTAAVAKRDNSWTDLYVSNTRKQFVYSCSLPIYGATEQLLGVSVVDIHVDTLSYFLGTLRILEHGRAFVINAKDQVIGVPMQGPEDIHRLLRGGPSIAGGGAGFELYPLQEFPDVGIRSAMSTWMKLRRPGIEESDFEVTGVDGSPYLVRMLDYPFRPDLRFTIGVIVPKEDVLGEVNRNTWQGLLAIGVLLLISLAVGVQLSRWIARSLSQLAVEVERVGRLDLSAESRIPSQITEVVAIAQAVDSMKKGLRSFTRYVPADLVRELHELRQEATLGGERRTLTIFFSDIAEFSAISERLSPEELVEHLSDYFRGMSQTIHQHGGTVDKYIGDSVMAFWGAPVARPDHALRACRCALACQAFLDQLNLRNAAADKPLLRTRIGLHTGEVIVGNFGYEERLNYTIMGDGANLASRLEGLNKHYGTRILISGETLALVAGHFVTRPVDRVVVKGKSRWVDIHELIAETDGVSQQQLLAVENYSQGFDRYLVRDWVEARACFQRALAATEGADAASRLMIARCDQLESSPPEAEWNGAYVHTTK